MSSYAKTQGALVPRPPPLNETTAAGTPTSASHAVEVWTPSKPFQASADYVSPRRPPSAVSSTKFAKNSVALPATVEQQEDRRRVAVEADENRAYTALWLKYLSDERDLAQPSMDHIEADHRSSIHRSELQQRHLVLRTVEARLDAFASQRCQIALALSSPLLNEHRRGAEALYDKYLEIVQTLALDFLGVDRMAVVAADSALVALLKNGPISPTRSNEGSPRRDVAVKMTAAPPSSMFPGDVGGGRLRWSEEKQWKNLHRSLAAALQTCAEDEENDRSTIVASEALDHAKLHQAGLAQYYAAQREEAARLEREDIAVYCIRYEPDAADETLARDENGLPTAHSIRERKCLLRLQRCGRGLLDRRTNAYPLYRARLAFEAWCAKRHANAGVIQRMIRAVLSRVARARRTTLLRAAESIRLHDERREMFAEIIQQFVHQWLSSKEVQFRRDAPHQTVMLELQAWLSTARAKHVDEEEGCSGAFLLPVLSRPTQPEEPVGINLGRIFNVVPILVSSDADLEADSFLSHWNDFNATVIQARVGMVGLDAEWVGDNHPALIQISDTKRCFLFRSCFLSHDKLIPLLQPLMTAVNVFKCGVGVRHDRKKLEGMKLGPVAALFDLVNIVAAVDLLPEEGRSLEQITRASTGLPMFKKKSVTVSNWEAAELSEAQIQYATDDAVAGLAILAAAIERARQIRVIPPARHGRWVVADDDAVYLWLNAVASMKPPPVVKQTATSRSNSSSPPPQQQQSVAATPASPVPHIPGPDDIRLAEVRPLYDNIHVLSIAGKHIFTCDMKKALWYVKKKKLAAVTRTTNEGKILEIQLNFEPAAKTKICMNWQLGSCSFGSECLFAHGVEELVPAKNVVPLPEDDPDTGYGTPADSEEPAAPPPYDGPALSPPRTGKEILDTAATDEAPTSQTSVLLNRLAALGRANACTVCLVSGAHCSKFAVVPSYFRRHLALDFRRARSLDYVLVCSQCLPRVHATYNGERKRLWEQAVRHLSSADRSARLSYATASRLYRYCEMLNSAERMAEIPSARKAEIEEFVLRTFPRSVLGGDGEALTIETILQYVTSYEIQDWTHSTEAMDVTAHWRDVARVRESMMPQPRTEDEVEVDWSIQFIKHWRRIFETQLRPVLVPWEQS